MLELRSLAPVPALDDVGFAVRPGVLACDSSAVLWDGVPVTAQERRPTRFHAPPRRSLA
jgi:hypothetical protein